MSRETEGSVQPKDLESWRSGLLRVVLTAGAGAIVCSWSAIWLAGLQDLADEFEYVLLLAGMLPLLASFGQRLPRLTSWMFVFSQLLPMSHVILVSGWAPAVVVWLIFLTVFAGLLSGKPAALFVVGGASLVHCFGGLIAAGIVQLPHIPPLEAVPPAYVDTLTNWAAVALIFASFNGAASWGVGRLYQLIELSTRHHTEQVALLRERHALLTATRFERDEKTDQLQETQRFQMVTQLGRGFNQLFGDTLSAVRNAIREAQTASATRVVELAQQIMDLVQHTASRSQDVMSLLRPLPQPASTIHLSRSINAVTYRYRAQLRPSVSLEVDAPIHEHAGVGEPWLEQVLLNLLLNSDHALGSRGGKILVQARRLELTAPHSGSCGTLEPGAYAVMRVCDTGPGIRRDTATRAFEPFYSEWGPPHSGIGLTTVFEMSRQVGGNVEIENPSQGASIAVYLPLSTTRGEAPESSGSLDVPMTLVEWKDRALRLSAKWSAVCVAVAVVAAEVQRWFITEGRLTHLLLGLPMLMACVYVSRSSAAYTRRLYTLLWSVFLGSALFTLNMGFMAPGGIAGLSLMTLLSRMLDSRRVSIACLLLTAWSLVAIGAIRIGLHLPPPQQTNLAIASNWFRVAMTLPSMALIAGISILTVVASARASISHLVSLESSLTQTEQQLRNEARSVSNIDRITARASDLETMGRMTGAVAHDVGNSLQAITAWASTLTSPNEALEMRSEALAAIEEAVTHAEALLADLDLNRLGAKEPTVIDIGSVTQRLTRLLRALLGSSHTLTVETAENAMVVTHSDLYYRALFNLVANARDAMSEPGTCAIRVVTNPDTVCVSVEDDGSGMDDITRARLFATSFTTKGSQGHGLGLASVATLLKASSGTAETWSELRRGTRITLTFPRAQRPLIVDTSPSTGSSASASPSAG